MNKTRAHRGLDRATHRQLSRYRQLLMILAAVCLAAAAAVLVAWLLGTVLNGAIAA